MSIEMQGTFIVKIMVKSIIKTIEQFAKAIQYW